jgi:hypothetical protein
MLTGNMHAQRFGMPDYIRRLRAQGQPVVQSEPLPEMGAPPMAPPPPPPRQTNAAPIGIMPQGAQHMGGKPKFDMGLFNQSFDKPKMTLADKLGIASGYLMDLDGSFGAGNADKFKGMYDERVGEARSEFDTKRQQQLMMAAAQGDMNAMFMLDPSLALGEKRDRRNFAAGRADRADDVDYRDRVWLRDENRYESEQERLARIEEEDKRRFDLNYGLDQRRTAATEAAAAARANPPAVGTRYLSPEELKAAGYPEGAVVQVDAKGEDSVRFKPSAEFSAGEIKGFRDKSNVLSEFDRTLNEYKTLVSTSGLKKLHKPDDVDAARLDALKQSLTFQAKDLLNLGILSKDDYENLDRLIPDATGLGAMWKNKDSFNASLGPLEATITSQIGMIPEQYRSGNAATIDGAARTPPATSAAPRGGGQMPYVDNPASYEAVPPGGYYVGPDGQTRQKPHYLPIGG